jgi:hypothetical protein
MRGIFRVADELLFSQKGLYFMEFISYSVFASQPSAVASSASIPTVAAQKLFDALPT